MVPAASALCPAEPGRWHQTSPLGSRAGPGGDRLGCRAHFSTGPTWKSPKAGSHPGVQDQSPPGDGMHGGPRGSSRAAGGGGYLAATGPAPGRWLWGQKTEYWVVGNSKSKNWKNFMLNTTSESEPNPPPAYLLGDTRPNCHRQWMHGVRTEGGRTARSSSCHPMGWHVAGHPPKITAAASSTSSQEAGEPKTLPQPSGGITRVHFSGRVRGREAQN